MLEHNSCTTNHTCEDCSRDPEYCFCDKHLDEKMEKVGKDAYDEGYSDGYKKGLEDAPTQ